MLLKVLVQKEISQIRWYIRYKRRKCTPIKCRRQVPLINGLDKWGINQDRFPLLKLHNESFTDSIPFFLHLVYVIPSKN